MTKLFSHVPALAVAALVLTSTGAQAQDNATVGSPLLRDFDLQGRRTTPPAEQTQPQPSPPPAETPRAEEPEPRQTAPQPRPDRVSPSPAPSRAPQPNQASTTTPQGAAPAQPEATAPAESSILDSFGTEPAAPAPYTPPPIEEPLGTVVDEGGASFWPWALAALALAGLALLLFRRRRAGELNTVAAEPAMQRSAQGDRPAPKAAAPATPAPAFQLDMRPWLELEFRPERLVATDDEAVVHFELVVLNKGRSAARNVHIQAKMFNPSPNQKRDITAFFATPVEVPADAMSIPPQIAAKFKSKVVMPKSSAREIQVQGRSIFVPTVAINLVYEFGDGRKGQTSNSWVVGTETAESEKMGPFRLDLGPRIYRHLGGRSLDLARAV